MDAYEVIRYKGKFTLRGNREDFVSAFKDGTLNESDVQFKCNRQRAMLINMETMRRNLKRWDTRSEPTLDELGDDIVYDIYTFVSNIITINDTDDPSPVRINHLIYSVGYSEIRSFIHKLIESDIIKRESLMLEYIDHSDDHIMMRDNLLNWAYERILADDLDIELIIDEVDSDIFIKEGELTKNIRLLGKLHEEDVFVGKYPRRILSMLNADIESVNSYRTFLEISLPDRPEINRDKIVKFALEFIRGEEV